MTDSRNESVTSEQQDGVANGLGASRRREVTTAWALYILRTRQGHLYTGIATDVRRRIEEHSGGRGAKALRGRGPLDLVYRKRIGEHGLALRLEHRLKLRSKHQKEEIVRQQPTRAKLLALLLPGSRMTS